MRTAWAHETRIAEVRRAAEAWRGAGTIDAKTLFAIEAAYPEPRPRLAAAWRVLIFFLVTLAIGAIFSGIAIASADAATAVAIVFGALLAFATEILRGSRLAGNGSDAAASFSAIVYLLAGIALAWLQLGHGGEEPLITSLLALAVVLFAAACVHWGYAAYGALAAASFFLLLGRAPAGRLWWVLAGTVLAVLAYVRLDRAYPPPLRRAVGGVLAVSAAALYVAVNRYSLDNRWIESLRAAGHSETGPATEVLDLFSAAATALLPIVFLWWGIRARRSLILDLGLVFSAASLVTLRFYVHLAPLWLLLTVAGAALILTSLWLNRWLRTGSGGERGGFTAAPLFSGRRESLQAAAVVAGFTGPAAHAPATAASPGGDLSTGGGRFGGGGASGDF